MSDGAGVSPLYALKFCVQNYQSVVLSYFIGEHAALNLE